MSTSRVPIPAPAKLCQISRRWQGQAAFHGVGQTQVKVKGVKMLVKLLFVCISVAFWRQIRKREIFAQSRRLDRRWIWLGTPPLLIHSTHCERLSVGGAGIGKGPGNIM